MASADAPKRGWKKLAGRFFLTSRAIQNSVHEVELGCATLSDVGGQDLFAGSQTPREHDASIAKALRIQRTSRGRQTSSNPWKQARGLCQSARVPNQLGIEYSCSSASPPVRHALQGPFVADFVRRAVTDSTLHASQTVVDPSSRRRKTGASQAAVDLIDRWHVVVRIAVARFDKRQLVDMRCDVRILVANPLSHAK